VPKSILTVCIGNICRSPMAQALIARRLAGRGLDAAVESAGLAAQVGRAADPIAQELMRERGLDLSGHRARQLTPELLRAFEIVLVMEAAQQRAVEGMWPSARGRVYRIGRSGDFDVPDPYRRDRAAFEMALALIERGVDDLELALFGEGVRGQGLPPVRGRSEP
jgi:protein-tyrosine phosphatase